MARGLEAPPSRADRWRAPAGRGPWQTSCAKGAPGSPSSAVGARSWGILLAVVRGGASTASAPRRRKPGSTSDINAFFFWIVQLHTDQWVPSLLRVGTCALDRPALVQVALRTHYGKSEQRAFYSPPRQAAVTQLPHIAHGLRASACQGPIKNMDWSRGLTSTCERTPLRICDCDFACHKVHFSYVAVLAHSIACT